MGRAVTGCKAGEWGQDGEQGQGTTDTRTSGAESHGGHLISRRWQLSREPPCGSHHRLPGEGADDGALACVRDAL